MVIVKINNFLTFEECDKFIDQIDNKKNINEFTNSTYAKTDKYISNDLANYFYEKIKEKNISELQDVIRPNNLIMTAKYDPGMEFGIHTDTGLYYNKKENISSKYTVLVYLNDDFEHGETIFYDNYFTETDIVKPIKGTCIIFNMTIFHKGAKVEKGYKYWIGCELIAPLNDT